MKDENRYFNRFVQHCEMEFASNKAKIVEELRKDPEGALDRFAHDYVSQKSTLIDIKNGLMHLSEDDYGKLCDIGGVLQDFVVFRDSYNPTVSFGRIAKDYMDNMRGGEENAACFQDLLLLCKNGENALREVEVLREKYGSETLAYVVTSALMNKDIVDRESLSFDEDTLQEAGKIAFDRKPVLHIKFNNFMSSECAGEKPDPIIFRSLVENVLNEREENARACCRT